ncbi:MAG: hypothetical protein WD044_12120 [Dongiaceae bacterium]
MNVRYWIIGLVLALGLWIAWNLFVHQEIGGALRPITWLMEQMDH